ncbi:hypothetical protein QCN29_09305 [Streptomyces sp. HNM0663]|uniref:Uncharacterized protein n=1 Tax=Streptomyces chengmaiensis TaxID=3040919 RepID=A0ABT6HL52_9ACTN|nr:hypothetical protein [Streptomyces chengmaiensis]MDH2388983.1 hypothetical protein [Streptomyces chengmaiensis]
MRSARILFAATAAAATLAITAPGAYAITEGGDKDDSPHSQERDYGKPKGGMHAGSGALARVSGDDWSKDEHGKDEHGKDEHGKKDYGKPKGGMHAGSGALARVGADDWSKDEHGKDEHGKDEHGKKDYGKPKGGMHTGSGALSLVNADDWSKDKGKEGDGYKHDKPKGGMHTGGGGLANSTTNVTGAVVVAGGLAAFVLYRRRKAAGTAS